MRAVWMGIVFTALAFCQSAIVNPYPKPLVPAGGGSCTGSAGELLFYMSSSGTCVGASGITTPDGNTLDLSGTGAGTLGLAAGAAPSLVANQVQIAAPTSVTNYQFILPGASGSGLLLDTASANVDTLSRIALGNGVATALATNVSGTGAICLASGSACSGGGGSTAWNSITNPTGNLALTMSAYTSAFTYGATTGSGIDLFKLTDTASNTGTGNILRVSTAASSSAHPIEFDNNGNGIQMSVLGVLAKVGTGSVNADQINGATIPASASPVCSNGSSQIVNCTVTGSGTTVVLQTSPVITSLQDTIILDGNGNPFILSSATASAVDSVTITNAATANPATVAVKGTGTDSNINLNFVSKGSGVVEANGNQVVTNNGTALTNGYLLFATAASGTIGNSNCNQGVTTANTLTCSDTGGFTMAAGPITSSYGSIVSGLSGTAGTFTAYNNTAATIWASAATTNNTIKGFATAPVTGDLVECVVSSTTCTLTDSGVLASALSNVVYCTGSNSATAATCTGSPAPTTYTNMTGFFLAGATSTGAPLTLNINSLGAKNVYINGAATSTTNFVINGQIYPFVYDGTQIQLAQPNQFPSSISVGSSAPSLTGTGIFGLGESTGQACASAADCFLANSSSHQLLLSNNNATAVPVAVTPATTTNGYVPQYSGTVGSILGAGLPVATTSTANALVETGSGGTINSNFVPTGLSLGTSTATTQSACNNSTDVATTAYMAVACNTVQTSGSPFALTAQSQTQFNNTSGAYVWDLPATASGIQICIGNYKTVAHAISLVPPSGSTIYYKGVAGTTSSSTGLVSGGAAGDEICVEATDSTTWEVWGPGQGTWTNN